MNPEPATKQPRLTNSWRLATAVIVGAIALAVGACELMGWPFLAKPAERWLSSTLQRRVVLTTTDENNPAFTLRLIGGIRLTLGHLELGAPGWSKAPHMLKAENVSMALNYGDILAWRNLPEASLRIEMLRADLLDAQLERLADGRASWQLNAEEPSPEPRPLPNFGLLAIKVGTIRYNDEPLELNLNAQLSLQEGEAEGDALKVNAEGDYQNKKLNIQLTSSGAMPWVAQDADPIPLALNITLGGTILKFSGEAADALKMQKLSGDFVLSGPSLAPAGQALGITLPNTPAFRTEGKLTRDVGTWKASIKSATIGSSRLQGHFQYEGAKKQPLLSGVLQGPSLVLADLGPTVGAELPPAEKPKESKGRVLPTKQFDLPSLRAMDANVRIDIDNLDLGSDILRPLRPLRAHLVLSDGVLRISDIDAKTAQGELAGMVQLDGREDVARWDVDLKWQGVQLAKWLKTTRAENQPPYITGRMNGAATLKGEGRSSAEILGSLDGTIRTQIQDGTISHLMIEAAGLDAAESLGVWFGGDNVLQMTCAFADLQASDGVLRPRAFVIDTQDSALWVNGSISMKTEAMDLRVVVTPKDFSPLSLRTPLLVTGTMGSPDVSLEKGPLAGKVAGSVLLSLLNPFAALIPFVDTGTPDSEQNAGKTGCYDLVARSKAQRDKLP